MRDLRDSLAKKIEQELLALKTENLTKNNPSILLEQELLLEIALKSMKN